MLPLRLGIVSPVSFASQHFVYGSYLPSLFCYGVLSTVGMWLAKAHLLHAPVALNSWFVCVLWNHMPVVSLRDQLLRAYRWHAFFITVNPFLRGRGSSVLKTHMERLVGKQPAR